MTDFSKSCSKQTLLIPSPHFMINLQEMYTRKLCVGVDIKKKQNKTWALPYLTVLCCFLHCCSHTLIVFTNRYLLIRHIGILELLAAEQISYKYTSTGQISYKHTSTGQISYKHNSTGQIFYKHNSTGPVS